MLSCFTHVRHIVTPSTVAHPASLSMGFSPARILEWVPVPSSKRSSQPRDRTCVSYISCTSGRFFTAEPPLAVSSWANYLNFLTHRMRIMVVLISQGFGVSISWVNTYNVLGFGLVSNVDSDSRLLEFTSQHCYLGAMWPWTSYLTLPVPRFPPL